MKKSRADASKKKTIKKVAIVYRPESKAALKSARDAAKWLQARDVQVFAHPKQKIATGIRSVRAADMKRSDLILVLGGDGTYLEAVRLLNGSDTPILGVNMGSLGFLTENRKEDLFMALEATLEGRMQQRPRSMLSVQIRRGGKIAEKMTSLNDVVIERGSISQLINIAIYAEKHLVNEVKADGLVIATPTGSTAYNLAAGGPILHPQMQAMVVTPICPHSLTHRPIIFPDEQVLTFKLLNKKHRAYLTVDGQKQDELQAGDQVVVTRAKCSHYVLRHPSHNYFDLLRMKLRFGERN